MAARFKARKSFTVPATSGQYAPERITFPSVFGSGLAEEGGLLGITALVESGGAAGAVVEVWLPKVGATGIDADYTLAGTGITSGQLTMALASFPGAQIRVKSGGTAGTTTVDATAD